MQLIIKILQPVTRLITIYLKFFPFLGSREITLASFSSELTDPFPSVSFSLPVPQVLYFLDFCPQHSVHCFCSLWMILPTSVVSAIIKCLSLVQTEPKSSRYTSPTLYCIWMSLKLLKISTSTLYSSSPFKSAPFCPFLVDGIAI